MPFPSYSLTSYTVDSTSTPSEESWWPTIGKFEDSGLNLGVWTPKCEEWFVRRRLGILNGTNRPYNASTWRNVLRFEMETKRVYKGAKIIAERYIEQQYGQSFFPLMLGRRTVEGSRES